MYEITEAGRTEATQRIEDAGGTPWELANRTNKGMGEFRDSIRQLIVAATQVSSTGSQEQIERVNGILKRARKEIYAMLAED